MYRVLLLFYLALGVLASDENSPRILIIGAGASGIAAASKLIENGLENVVILEAEDRVGGRIYTTELDGYNVDLGAQWVHGEKGNAVFELAYPLDLLAHAKPHELDSDLYAPDGTLVDPDIANATRNYFVNIQENSVQYIGERNDSMGDYFVEKLHVYFAEHPEINEKMQMDFCWLFNLYEIAADGADNWYDVSPKQFSEYHVSEGDNIINWKERGYSTLFDILTKKIPKPEEELSVLDKVVLNSEVTKIDYSNEDGPVKVTTSDGKEYLADHVIVTVSLGVLKADHETLFDPPLSEEKINSIEGIGFGAAAKIWLTFNDSWWENRTDDVGAFIFFWSEAERTEFWADPETKWIPSISAAVFNDYKPRSLLLWVSGEGARHADTLPDELLFSHAIHVLNKFLGMDFNISPPVGLLRSQWTTNKHFRGTYSFNSLDTDRLNATREALAEPIMRNDKPLIQFAGEATNLHQFSTVHGAVTTGWREAERLVHLYKDDKN